MHPDSLQQKVVSMQSLFCSQYMLELEVSKVSLDVNDDGEVCRESYSESFVVVVVL